MSTDYEWTWEVTDEHGDIVAQDFWSTFAECRADAPEGADIALIRRVGSDEDGEL